MNTGETVELAGHGWSASFNPTSGSRLLFSAGGRELLSLSGMAFGKVSESSGYCTKSRRHESIDMLSCSAEFANAIPFGSEPQVLRQFEFAGNHAKVTSDFDLRAGMDAGTFEVDNFFVPGKWKRIGIVRIKGQLPAISDMEWHDVLDKAPLNIRIGEVPLLMLFEDADGFRLEVGTGDDLWRWNLSETFPGAEVEFGIEGTGQGIIVRRIVAAWPEPVPIPPRKYRFTWYFSWEIPGMERFSCDARDFTGMELSEDRKFPSLEKEFLKFPAKGPARIFAARFAEKYSDAPCFHSSPVSGFFRDWIRSAVSRGANPVAFGGLDVPLCDASSHLERPQKQALLHWSMIRVFDLWLWANRQLKNSGSSFHMIPSDNGKIFSALPSVRGLSGIFSRES